MFGYTLVWLGQFESAADLLEDIPESRSEMETYARWWQQRNQLDLAQKANRMLTYLGE